MMVKLVSSSAYAPFFVCGETVFDASKFFARYGSNLAQHAQFGPGDLWMHKAIVTGAMHGG